MQQVALDNHFTNFIHCQHPSSVASFTVQQQILLNMVMEYSRHQQSNINKNTNNSLPMKYRKMIPNMKMKKSTQSCTICLQKFCEGQLIKKLPCGHILHRQCAKQWLKVNKKCPICRFNLQEHFLKVQLVEKTKLKLKMQKNEGIKLLSGDKCQHNMLSNESVNEKNDN